MPVPTSSHTLASDGTDDIARSTPNYALAGRWTHRITGSAFHGRNARAISEYVVRRAGPGWRLWRTEGTGVIVDDRFQRLVVFALISPFCYLLPPFFLIEFCLATTAHYDLVFVLFTPHGLALFSSCLIVLLLLRRGLPLLWRAGHAEVIQALFVCLAAPVLVHA